MSCFGAFLFARLRVFLWFVEVGASSFGSLEGGELNRPFALRRNIFFGGECFDGEGGLRGWGVGGFGIHGG